MRKVLVFFGIITLLSGCSSIPDAVNPLNWYDAAKEAIMGKKTEKVPTSDDSSTSELADNRGKALLGSEKSFPSLGTVPKRPVAPDGKERKEITEGLVSDREDSRQYSSQIIQRQGENRIASDVAPKVKISQEPKVVALKSSGKALVSEETIRKRLPKKLNPLNIKGEQSQVVVSRVKPPYIKKKAKPLAISKTRSARQSQTTPNLMNLSRARNLSFGTATVVISGSGVVTTDTGDRNYDTPMKMAPNNLKTRSLMNGKFDRDIRSYQVATILFDNGSAKLNTSDRKVLRQVVAHHKQKGGTLRVVGHASHRTQNLDPARHQLVNFKISAARADAVLKQLVRYGTRPSNLMVSAVSDTMPIYFESMPSGEAGNRRAEIFLDF